MRRNHIITNIITNILNFGIEPSTLDRDKISIQYINTIALFALLFSGIGLFGSLLIVLDETTREQVATILIGLVVGVASIIALYLSKHKKFEYAKLILVLSVFLVIIVSNLLFEFTSGEFIYYLFLPILLFNMFKVSKKLYFLLFFIIISIILATLYRYYYGAFIIRSDEVQFYALLANLLIAMSATSTLMYYHAIKNMKLYNQLDLIASTDTYTCLSNRFGFEKYFNTLQKRLKKEDFSLSIIFCDVDFFKEYNDRYGHIKGDIALKNIAQIMLKNILDKSAIVVRFGGDEFVIVIINLSKQSSYDIVQHIRKEIENLKIINNGSKVSDYLTITAGLYWLTPNSGSLSQDDLIKKADALLYKAKKQGRNRVCSSFDIK